MPDGRCASVTDLPATFVTVTRDGRTKRVEDYVGAPEGLETLERQIDAAAVTKRWIWYDERARRNGPNDDHAAMASVEMLRRRQAARADVITRVKCSARWRAPQALWSEESRKSSRQAEPLLLWLHARATLVRVSHR
jgi:hypothetical protein